MEKRERKKKNKKIETFRLTNRNKFQKENSQGCNSRQNDKQQATKPPKMKF